MTSQRKQLLLLVAVIVLIVLAGVFFRNGDTPLATPGSTGATVADGSTTLRTTSQPTNPKPTDARTSKRATIAPSVDAEGMATVALADLPPEARDVHRLLLASGPFAYTKDGTVFGNREGLLPKKQNGYYREFTVETPGSADRGARRLVVGGCGKQTSTRPVRATACSVENPIYYTGDHYETFRRVV